MGRYLLPDTEMPVRLSKEPKRDIRTVEITVPMGNGVILRSEASEPESLFLAIDQALAKMERQIHRHRSKLDKRIRDDAFASNELEFIEDEDAAAEESRAGNRSPQDLPRASDVCRGRRCSDGNAGTQLLRVRQRRKPRKSTCCISAKTENWAYWSRKAEESLTYSAVIWRMSVPRSAACRFFDLPPVNLQNLPLHLTKNSSII